MKTYPAIALLELNNIADGIRVGDGMIKKAPIQVLRSGTVSHGKFLILVGGTVASVDEAYQEGVCLAGSALLDSLNLPDVHPRVVEALTGHPMPVRDEAVGILETPSIATTVEASDVAIKGAQVNILTLRLGDGFGGKGYVLLNGRVEDVQAAVELACQVANRKNVTACYQIIPRIHEGMARQIEAGLRFVEAPETPLPDGEADVTG